MNIRDNVSESANRLYVTKQGGRYTSAQILELGGDDRARLHRDRHPAPAQQAETAPVDLVGVRLTAQGPPAGAGLVKGAPLPGSGGGLTGEPAQEQQGGGEQE